MFKKRWNNNNNINREWVNGRGKTNIAMRGFKEDFKGGTFNERCSY